MGCTPNGAVAADQLPLDERDAKTVLRERGGAVLPARRGR